jgi:catechol 2,3-dioxygenase-like lactoylglutathione lyase family enzyme
MSVRYHQGRLIDHIHLRVSDVEVSKRFYFAVLEALGMLEGFGEGKGYFYADELFVDRADHERSSLHIAFQASDEAVVNRFYEAGIRAGGKDNGRPGLRKYHAGYYAAFVLDPDGNNVEAVCHGSVIRSADSVLVERKA